MVNEMRPELKPKKAELKAALLEIIDALICIIEEQDSREWALGCTINREKAAAAIKKSLSRFCAIYKKDYRLRGAGMRVRLKGRMMAGFMCSGCSKFPKTEALWRVLHNYRVRYRGKADPNLSAAEKAKYGKPGWTGTVFLADHPEKKAEFEIREKGCIMEVDEAIKRFPIEKCTDYGHLVEAFDMMKALAHCIFIFKPEGLFDSDWRKVNPWAIGWRMYKGKKVPTGKSMLVDYWWNVPPKLRQMGHYVLDKLAGKEIKSVEDLRKLRKEVLAW